MKYSTFIAAAALCLSATTTQAQTPKTMLKANKIINEIFSGRAFRAAMPMAGAEAADHSSVKPAQTTTYAYANGSWIHLTTDKMEYDTKGNTTATETMGKEGKTRMVYTYDDKLEGCITQATSYSWNATTAAWENPTVMAKTELTRDDKGRVTKETVYAYDEDTKTLEKETEIEFGYALISGQMNSMKMTMTTEDETGNDMTIPVTLTILKWHSYNPDKLFTLPLDDMDPSAMFGSDNLIESATLSMTIQNIPVAGTIKGEYTETSSTINFSIPLMQMSMKATMTITDSYGSNKTEMTMDMMGKNVMSSTITNTNNEHGDCIKTVSEGTTAESLSFADEEDADLDLNQTMTFDYEYTTLSDNKVLKSSMVTNVLDKKTNEMKPTAKVTYDLYTDYLTGTTNIGSIHRNASTSEINAVYGINGARMNKLPQTDKKGVYIIKNADRTIKVMK